jgi:RNA polymerase sigma-70 factor (ECF subfamily)
LETISNKQNQANQTRWLDSHGDYLYRYALTRVRDEAVAEELLQETLLAATAVFENHADGNSERSWLAGILKQKVFDYFRRIARSPEFQSSSTLERHEPDVYEKTGIWQGHWREDSAPLSWPKDISLPQSREFWNTFERCLSSLPSPTAIALTLREIDGLSTNQICEILDLNPSDLGVILHCGRVKLRQLLEAEWLTARRPLNTTARRELSYRAITRESRL